MDRKKFLVIVILTGLSLGGIIFIQFFWIRNAIQLREEQFNNSVMLSLKGIVNEMYECKKDTCEGSLFCSDNCSHRMTKGPGGINRAFLDSLVHAEFGGMGLKEPYVYGIFNPVSKNITLISDNQSREALLGTNHTVSLSCIYRASSYQLGAFFPDEGRRAWYNILWWLVLCFMLIAVLVFGLSFTIYSFLRQKKLSEMKSDFVNNMTHEFKTPISTISLASEMLLKPAVINSAEKARKYATIIFDENQRLRNQVDHILQIALLDKEEFRLMVRETNVHELIEQLAESFRMALKEKNGVIQLQLDATRPGLIADPMHLRNIISNLLDNANKYSSDKPLISIMTSNSPGGILISVEDNGIGISHENQKQVFKKLYRVSTGNVHDVKGFGLGLFYVKAMVEAHGGWIRLKSELSKGSRFDIFLPFGKDNGNAEETNGK